MPNEQQITSIVATQRDFFNTGSTQSQIEVELIVSRTRTLNKVNALLTPDQRELLAHLLSEGR